MALITLTELAGESKLNESSNEIPVISLSKVDDISGKDLALGTLTEVPGETKLSDEIPVISLSGFDDVGGKRGEICRKIVEACVNWGMFQVIDHGVDTNMMADMTRLAREFFLLPLAEKLRFDMSGGKEGGFSVSSHLQGEAMRDWREVVLYSSYPVKKRDYSRWPDTPEGWVKVTEEFSEKAMGLACKVLDVLSEAMGLEKDAITKLCIGMEQKIVINYFPQRPKPDLALGMRHSDHGIITVLLQDQVSCLKTTRDNGKTWVTVPFVEGAFVVNLGDICHYLSNGRFMTSDHQAVVDSNASRLFINTFQFPAPHAMVYPLKVGDGEKAIMEEPLTFEEITNRRMKEIMG
ncbi:unnamed protein product [Microthlaspi erraticum]|uniref:Naringenin,2-oxoglutarate 3-dioxygenase n=1 Tax=Microthlaspi erraticum TaxID=1685480 RepID=A0A6D2J6M1_9BRAS|nr:unnamed protein product [Microthlaspi erraticum]